MCFVLRFRIYRVSVATQVLMRVFPVIFLFSPPPFFASTVGSHNEARFLHSMLIVSYYRCEDGLTSFAALHVCILLSSNYLQNMLIGSVVPVRFIGISANVFTDAIFNTVSVQIGICSIK